MSLKGVQGGSGGGGGSGTVTSVGLALPSDFTISGSPVTVSGTLTGAWAIAPTGTGAVVRTNSPTLVTPNLGTPSAVDLANASNLPISAIAGLGTGMAAMLASATGAIFPITAIFNGGGSAVPANSKGDLMIPFACTITAVTLLADQSGSIVIDIWKDSYANYPPTVADSITAAAKPTITTAVKSQDTTLTGWTTTLAAGDTLRFNVDSATTITRCALILTVRKT